MIQPIAFVIAAVLSCPLPKVENKTNTWDKQDQEALLTATSRCKEIYPDAPCLKMFRKADEGIYSALCGSGEDSNGKVYLEQYK